jgi:branched-chain amino acid transport system permease protein
VELFASQVLAGLANGAIYASLALALVLIYRSTGIVNFAQGEMAMFSTYLAWQLTQWGVPILLAVLATLAVSFAGGVLVERVIVRHVEGAPELALVIVTIGLFILINAAAGFIWSYLIKPVPSPFPPRLFTVPGLGVSPHTVGTLAVTAVVVGLFYLLLQRTKLGLAMRATAAAPESSRLVGIPVGWMLALGWGLAAMVGAVSGVLVAPIVFLEPNMMAGIMVYAFAAATLGGFDSLPGAVLGGLFVGVGETLAATYVDAIGSDLKIVVPLAIIVAVLLVRPQGLLGSRIAERA